MIDTTEDIAPEDRRRLTSEQLAALIAEPAEKLVEQLGELHPDDAAELMALLPEETLLKLKPDQELLEVVEGLADDDAADVVARMSEDTQEFLLDGLSEGETVERLMAYDPESAGGLMTTDVITVKLGTTVGQATEQIRDHSTIDERAHTSHVYVIDDHKCLKGMVPLNRVVLASRDRTVDDIMDPVEATVAPTMDQEEVARTIARYNVTAIPVLNEKGVLLGEVTFDDVIDVVEAEQTEDILKFGGMEVLDTPYMRTSVIELLKKRAGWLLFLFLGEMLTATAMGYFEKEIEKAVVLALFIPLIISSGGNSGSQATSLIIRAMALGEVTLKDWWRVVGRELPSGLALGAILGAVGFVRVSLWQAFGWYNYGVHHWLVASTIWIALIGVVGFGTIAGSMLPFVLRRLGFDPASASAPFVATLVDVTGIVIYFTVASIMLL